mgnify:CR=1 FL=1
MPERDKRGADRDHHAFIKQCLKKLGTDRCIALRGDVFRFIKSCHQQFDFIFCRSSYALPELPTLPKLILERGLLKSNGIFVFEHGKNNSFEDVPGFIEHRAYGSVNFSIFSNREPEGEDE